MSQNEVADAPGRGSVPARFTLLSGGQTGVDRGALDVALHLALPCGGWVPAGRWAEDGPIPRRYRGLRETPSRDTEDRTRRNVEAAHALLLILRGPPSGGTRLALETARELGRPVLQLDLARLDDDEAVSILARWLDDMPSPLRLNVAGPRESEAPGIGVATRRVLSRAFRRILQE